MFTAPGTDLNGLAYRAVLVFDTSIGIAEITPYTDAIYGGAAYGAASPAIGATLTIAGVTRAIGTDQSSFIAASYYPFPMFDPQVTAQFHSARHDFIGGGITESDFVELFVATSGSGLPANFRTPFGYRVQAGDDVHGAFMILHCCAIGNPDGTYALGQLRPTYVFAAVPEPTSWALLVSGFGLVGAAARRRRSAAVAA